MLRMPYRKIVEAKQNLSNLPEVQQATRTTLGEAVPYYSNSDGSWDNLLVLTNYDLRDPDDRRIWNALMLNFAADVLIMMAKSVGSKFDGCIVELFGTRIPTFGFAFE